MIASLMISLREGLEAALIIGIVFGYLRKTGQMRYKWYAWAGIAAAIVLSVVFAVAIQLVGAELEGTAEQIFEGVMMLLAVLVLTWMIFWMRYRARAMKSELESELSNAMQASSPRGFFAVTFFAVAREGVETALLLSTAVFATNGMDTLAGSMLGFAVAALIGVLLYATTVRLNMRVFFNVTGALMLLFAAGLLSNSLHEFQEAGVLITLQEHVWDLSHILSENSVFGQVLKAIFGYNSSPSLVEVIGYAAYWLLALLGVPWLVNRRISKQRSGLAAGLAPARRPETV